MTGARRRRLLQAGAVAGLAMVILALAYESTRGQPATRDSPPAKLSIALPVLPHYVLVHIAEANGYFAEEGLDVSMRSVPYGTTAIRDVIDGRADLAVAAEVPFVISVMKGSSLAVVASLASISGDNAVIARRDRAIATAHDLEGKKVGVTFATSGSYFLGAFLVRNKLSPESVTLVNLPPDRLVEALAGGSVDAVSAWQPISFAAQAALGQNGVSFTEDSYKTTIVAIADSEYLKGHADAVEKFLRAMLKAEQFMRSRPEEALKLAAEWLKVDVEVLRSTWKEFDFRINLLQSQLIGMEDEARWAMTRGYVATGPVPNFLPRVYLDALVAVEPDRVTVLR